MKHNAYDKINWYLCTYFTDDSRQLTDLIDDKTCITFMNRLLLMLPRYVNHETHNYISVPSLQCLPCQSICVGPLNSQLYQCPQFTMATVSEHDVGPLNSQLYQCPQSTMATVSEHDVGPLNAYF